MKSPGIINPLSVSIQKSGKKRLILDLRHINRHLFKNKFKCEDVSVAKEVLRPGDFMFSFDLKSGYYHIDISPEHRKFLAFFLEIYRWFRQIFRVFSFAFWVVFSALHIYEIFKAFGQEVERGRKVNYFVP